MEVGASRELANQEVLPDVALPMVDPLFLEESRSSLRVEYRREQFCHYFLA